MMATEDLRAAIYARVSSDQQTQAGTIASQVEALEKRVGEDGLVLDKEFYFLDDGYTGATLIRPALERLRDIASMGAIDRLYVHCPDRLARNYPYQVLLVDELYRCGVEIVFLNHNIGETPEEKLLLQVQGMVAEYERAKILERSRRGKLCAARQGRVNVLSAAPYGYRYIAASDGNGNAEYRIFLEEAKVVRQIFEWVGRDRLTLGQVCRRLKSEGIPSPKGKDTWDRATIWGMLKNPAYKGSAAFGKTRIGERRARLRPQRRSQEHPRRAHSTYEVTSDHWIHVPVPPIVNDDLFESVQSQLAENRKLARERRRGARFLLQGLVVCKLCGYALYGKRASAAAAEGKRRRYAYYRCIGSDAHRFGGQRICRNKQLRTDLLEDAVWADVRAFLGDSAKIEEEFSRRVNIENKGIAKDHIQQLEALVQKLKRGVARLIDAYSEGFLEKIEFEPRVKKAKARLEKLQAELKANAEEVNQQDELRLVITRIEDFSQKVKEGLQEADWNTQREIVRSLIKRIEVDEDSVRVIYRVDPSPCVEGSELGLRQHCCRGDLTAVSEHLYASFSARLGEEGVS